jgi:16S rRNA (adenine1518-N6/adenine1519-N6)-dimethyltransferase
MFRPSHLQSYLDEIGASAKKSLSQNFLIDGNILKKIIAVSALQPDDHVLEIGPGPGALTEQLLQAGAHVIAVEKDRLFAAHLPKHERLTVLEQDILDFDFGIINKRTKIIANLPYHLTSPIMGLFATRGELFSKMVIMVQHEVAIRMVARPGTPDYSSLSVFLQHYGKPSYAFKVSRRSFSPAPKVDSAIVVLDLEEKATPPDFFPFVRKGFQQKRKMLTSSLSEYGKEKVKEALASLGQKPDARPSLLSAEEWLKLYESLTL